jgi:hypothetical protein
MLLARARDRAEFVTETVSELLSATLLPTPNAGCDLWSVLQHWLVTLRVTTKL